MPGFSVIEQLETAGGLLDAKEVATLLGISTRKLYRHAEAQQIPGIRMGATWRFDPCALSYWVRKQNPTFAKAYREAQEAQ